jgi:hypothetical protein
MINNGGFLEEFEDRVIRDMLLIRVRVLFLIFWINLIIFSFFFFLDNCLLILRFRVLKACKRVKRSAFLRFFYMFDRFKGRSGSEEDVDVRRHLWFSHKS